MINVVQCQNILGEGPLWHSDEKALYWVDISAKKIQRYFPAIGRYEFFDLPRMVCALGLRQGGGFICAVEDGFSFWEPNSNHLEFIQNPEPGRTNARFNDGKVDRAGRFWAGTMTPRGATSALYRMDADLSVQRMASRITISNGIGWSPDNRTMYYVDSNRSVINAYAFEPASGAMSKKRIFKQFAPGLGLPDGLTVDSEGFVWCAIYDGWKVLRLNDLGQIIDEILMPVSRPSSVAFGGENLNELYITSISEGLGSEEKINQPMAGDLFMVRQDVKGIPEPKFAG